MLRASRRVSSKEVVNKCKCETFKMQKLFLVLLVFYLHPAKSLHKKCCDFESYLRKNNSIYFCDKNDYQRLQIFTNESNFLKNVGEGTCFDSYKEIVKYTILNHSVVEEKILPVNFYPKCCPLNFFYHSIKHSCVRKNNLDVSYITQNFIQVGLPQCKLIVDYKLTPGGYRTEFGNLYIDNRVRFLEGEFCIDTDEDDGLIARGCHNNLSICYDGIQCIHKCCPDGQSFVNGSKCTNTYENGLDLSFTDRVKNSRAPFAIIHKYDCRIYILSKDLRFYVDADGKFFAFSNFTSSYTSYGIEEKSYCIEHIKKKSSNHFEFLMCLPEHPIGWKFLITRWAKLISLFFIILTILVYCLLPEMLNLFGKILISYCVATLFLFGYLAYAQFVTNPSDKSCIITSFIFSYMSLASFTWMNVMCFDIWYTFGTPKSFITAKQKKSDLKKFLLYSCYGWGFPATLTLLTYLAYGVFNTPYVVRPILGSFKCFWERRIGNYGRLLYYIAPLIMMNFSNLVLFVRTVMYCLKVKNEINKYNDNRLTFKERKTNYNLDKEQLLLILKLGITMGVLFVFEVVSALFDLSANQTTEYIEIIWDTINCLQGFYIFLIFVCKKKVFSLCKNRIFLKKDRKVSVSSSATGTREISVPLTSKTDIRN